MTLCFQVVIHGFAMKAARHQATKGVLWVTESHTVVRVKAGCLSWLFVPNLSIIWRSVFKNSGIRKSSVTSVKCLIWAQNEMNFAKGTTVVLLPVYLQVCSGRWIFLSPLSLTLLAYSASPAPEWCSRSQVIGGRGISPLIALMT